MSVEHAPSPGEAPSAAELERRLRAEASGVHGWSNGPGDRYGEHEHSYRKVLYCVRGSIGFLLSDGKRIELRPGDRLVIPPGTRHGALVGPEGCTCIEGQG
ncbi:MAG: hypothetical protein A3H36_03245 [Chloroflexi bacterium RIFCSPLOWO2_02_FULL_71_16]|nr:MAG: hypothetical protein A3H36_03245 [Chloroflexi bacterium RIFCSPLOWO2_02_FULL_71_16]